MTDKNRREEYDEIIKMSIEMSKENDDELKELTDEDVIKMGYDLPPDDMYDRIIKTAEQSKPVKSVKTFRKIMVIAAIVVVTVILGIFVTSGVKHYSFDIDGEVTENAIEFRGTNKNDYVYEADEIEAYKSAEEALGTAILKPTYLPDGFEFDTIKMYANDYIILRYQSKYKTIKFRQELLDNQTLTNSISDEKYGNLFTLDFNEYIVEVGEQTQLETKTPWLKAIWKDKNITYTIDTDCTIEELEKFIKNLK